METSVMELRTRKLFSDAAEEYWLASAMDTKPIPIDDNPRLAQKIDDFDELDGKFKKANDD
ncbi:MAG: hypothetical protein Q9223_004039 [Gallowayella weberi]